MSSSPKFPGVRITIDAEFRAGLGYDQPASARTLFDTELNTPADKTPAKPKPRPAVIVK